MAAPRNEYAFDLEAAKAAARRWSARERQHEEFEPAVRAKRYSALDTPDRLAARANRLLGKLHDADPGEAAKLTREMREAAPAPGAPIGPVTAETISDAVLERVIGKTRDFLFVEFLERAYFTSKAVGRVVTDLGSGRVGYGTGFMVSPHLLLTNHHVLTSAGAAAHSKVEFDYQRDRFGTAVEVRTFSLDPGTFFLNDKDRDFALVAVADNDAGRPLRDYGWCPLLKADGKIVAGEPIDIVQHPLGELKQVVIRENRLIDSLDGRDLFYHYEADTEPGSSGSPVFNDQWEVVALHHSGIPRTNAQGQLLDIDGNVWEDGDDPARLDWVANEGVRVSKLVEFIGGASLPASAQPLLRELLAAKQPVPSGAGPAPPAPLPSGPHEDDREEKESPMPEPKPLLATATLTVPLHITFTLRIAGTAALAVAPGPAGRADAGAAQLERVEPDPDDPEYARRPGYQRGFLGFTVPFPKLTNVTRPKAYSLPGLSGDEKFELKYHHYSILFNKERKLAFVAGVNYDPTAAVQYQREGKDEWFYDPRVTPEEELQAGNDLYAGNDLDRGHLVRRADAAWGNDEDDAKLANDDTFHFTNCSPQHAITNQGKIKEAPPGLKLWGKLEDHIAREGKRNRRPLTIFNGPVFRNNDKVYRGVKIPREFWKVVIFANDEDRPAAAAFVLTQAELIKDLKEAFEAGEYKAVQVRVKDLETKTNLDFDKVRDWDVLEKPGAEEAFTAEVPAVVLDELTDIVL